MNSKTWVVEQDDGSFVSYAKLEFLANKVRNNNLFQCEATNKAMWIAGTAPYVVNRTSLLFIVSSNLHSRHKITTKCKSTRVNSGFVSFCALSNHIEHLSETILFALCLLTDAPLVTVLPTTVAAWEGETVELICTADSNPSRTTVVWYHDDINISDEIGGTFITYQKGNAHVLEITAVLR